MIHVSHLKDVLVFLHIKTRIQELLQGLVFDFSINVQADIFEIRII